MTLFDVIDATWPAAAQTRIGRVVLRDGKGGGKRVSAASGPDDLTAEELAEVLSALRDRAAAPLFQVQGDQPRLTRLLADHGFAEVEPVVILSAPIADVAGGGPKPVSAFTVWPPLAIQCEIWAEGGIGAPRLAVMERVQGPRTSLLGRVDNQPAGAAFVALHGDTAMLHALEVQPRHRRKGCAENLVRRAAAWARDRGAARFATLTLRDNAPARALFASLGMQPEGE